MPTIRSSKSKSTRQEFPWQGRLYAIRVFFTGMVLLVLLVNDAVCQQQPAAHFWLICAGALYPHLGHLLFGRLEGRRGRGYTLMMTDGLFSGAVIAAIGLLSAPGVLLAAINLFNWMVIGGPTLVALGAAAAVAGILVSGGTGLQSASTCMASESLAAAVLIGYFFVVARFIHGHIVKLRLKHLQFQADADATARARKLADRALAAVLPATTAEVLMDKGDVPAESIDGATLMMFEFVWESSDSPSIAGLADCLQICDAVVGRHGFECIKTFGRKYLAMSRAQTGADDAIAAAREVSRFLVDHRALADSPATRHSIRAFVHCGSVTAGLVEPSRLNFEILGEPVETLNGLAASSADHPLDTAVVSALAQSRMRKAEGIAAVPAGTSAAVYLFPLAPAS